MFATIGRTVEILLVEDDRFQSRLAETALSSHHVEFAVTKTTTLARAKELIRGNGFDLVLLDLSLPDSQGLDTLAEIVEAATDVPIVVLTGSDAEDEGVLAVRKGAQDYLVKRLGSYETLKDVLLRAMERHRLNRNHQAVLNAIPSLLLSFSPEGDLTWWNKRAAETLQINLVRDRGTPFEELGFSWDAKRVKSGLAAAAETRRTTPLDDLTYIRPDGTPGLLGLSIVPLADNVDSQRAFLILGSEITHRRQLESRVANQRKLEAIGQLAAGIAHEINTPTQFVGDNLAFLREGIADVLSLLDEYREALGKANAEPAQMETLQSREQDIDLEYLRDELPNAIEEALHGTDRISRIVKAMKQFSHPGNEDVTPTDLNAAIESTVTVSRNEWKYVARLELDLDPNLPAVPCHPSEINQVILNLIVNAAHAIADAMGESAELGTIRVCTKYVDGDALISISDNGTGIPEGVRDRIFDPFFTTKEVGKGTGQGLSLAFGIITKNHNGSLTFETKMGEGTTFFIRLPTGDEKPKPTNGGNAP